MDIAKVLRALRTDNGLTQQELSAKINIAQATIACYENGQRVPHITALMAYADFFDCSVDYIVGRCDEFGDKLSDGKLRTANILSDEELEILHKYRKLPKDRRTLLLGYIDGLSDRQ